MEPSTLATVLILTSAALHAVWNAMVKRSPDKMATMVFISGWGGLLYLPLIPLAPLPDASMMAFIAASTAIHLVYQLSLTRALDVGELTFVYPIARGLGPLLVAVFSLFFLPGDFEPLEFVAVLVLVSGIFLTTRNKTGNRAGLGAAILTGCMIASYTLIDGTAVKAAENPLTYVIWSGIAFAPILMTYTSLRHGRRYLWQCLGAWRHGLPASLMANTGYAIALYALSLGTIGDIAALRETSILFATLIGALWLKEKVTSLKVLAVSLIALGAVGLKLI